MSISEELLLQVIAEIDFDDKDSHTLLVRAQSNEILEEFGELLASHYPEKEFLLIEQSQVEVIGNADDDFMEMFGWIRKDKLQEVAELAEDLLESADTVDAEEFFEENDLR